MERNDHFVHSVERRHLRLSCSDDVPALQEKSELLPDLTIDDLDVKRFTGMGGYAAVINIPLPSAAVLHESVPTLIKGQLFGRNPFVWQEEGCLRIVFSVEDHGQATVIIVDDFARAVGAIMGVDEVGRQLYMTQHEPTLTLL